MALSEFVGEPRATPRLFVVDQVSSASSGRYEDWARALAIYRDSLRAYRQAVRIYRSQRSSPRIGQSADQAAGESTPPFEGALELTPRQREIAKLISGGLTNQQIADRLGLARGTVANQVANILARLAVQNRTQVAAYCCSPPPPAIEAVAAPRGFCADSTAATRMVLMDAMTVLAQSARLLRQAEV